MRCFINVGIRFVGGVHVRSMKWFLGLMPPDGSLYTPFGIRHFDRMLVAPPGLNLGIYPDEFLSPPAARVQRGQIRIQVCDV